jgi:capsular polysaccharide biosynthesis protein
VLKEMTLTLAQYLRLWRRRWATVIFVAAITGVSAGAAALATPAQFEATARFYVAPAGDLTLEARHGRLYAQERANSYVRLAAGTQLAERVVTALRLDMSAQELAARIAVTPLRNTALVDVTAKAGSAREAGDLANTAVAELGRMVQASATQSGGGLPSATVVVVDEAFAPAEPIGPTPLQTAFAATLGGLLLGVLAAVLRDRWGRTVHDSTDLAEATATPVLAGFGEVRAHLQVGGDGTRVLLVVGGRSSDAAADTALGAAVSLAEAGERVVLLDADPDQPTARMGPLPELLEVLPNLPGCSASDTATTLRQRSDYVLVVGPPVLDDPAALALAPHIDGVLLTVRRDVTTMADLAEALRRLTLADASLRGVILTDKATGTVGEAAGQFARAR